MSRRIRIRWVLCVLLVLAGAAVTTGAVWYHRFNHHVTPQEISHEVSHSMFDASIRDHSPIKLHLYQQANAHLQPLVIFTSGDGGWSPFCADVAAHIAATGKTVVGIDSKSYLTTFASSQKPVTPEELRRDYRDVIDASLSQAGVDRNAPLTLVGWSLGAGYSVLVAADDGLKNRLKSVVAISLPRYNELAWKPTDALIYVTHGTPHEKVFEAQDFLKQLAPVPLVMLNATDDDTSPLGDAQALFRKSVGPSQFFAVTAKGHHFEGGENEFYHDLDQSL
jgi:dienelactone hydrolase